MHSHRLDELQRRIAPARERLLRHPIYAAIDTETRLVRFTEHHVFAVWDFMSLLKALQQRLTCVTTPWLPTGDPAARRLVNAIVLGEESDDDGRGAYTSHFELYLAAMEDCGADTGPVRALCATLARRTHASAHPYTAIVDALNEPSIPAPSRTFALSTFDFVERGRASEIAAAFTFGREDVIPDMFRRFVDTLCTAAPERFERLRYYLDRHIELDGDDHGPKSLRMLSALCADDDVEWACAERAASRAIEARVRLWDGVHAALVSMPSRSGALSLR